MNDWIVANINNPDFTVSDFKDLANMSLNNTQMLKKEDYLKSDFIKNNPLFKDNEGEFSKDKFDQFYNQKLLEFSKFQNDEFPQELDIFDTDRTANTPTRDSEFFIGRAVNPDRQKIGIEGINVFSEPEKSKSELGQSSKIWDTETQTYKDYSPNDKALFNGKKDYGMGFLSSLFEDPLVLAQWEEEGTHIDPITKTEKKHKKGDYKLNNEGTYYYETLNGRSPIGKQTLSILDTITVDGTGVNKYDFFDSDDIEKSVSGVIAKNVATLLPMFIGGPVSVAYSTALIAREMSKSLPMIYNMATALADDVETPKWLNSIAAMGNKFTGGTSDYAKQHAFSIENFGNLISDVALQWGQQKTIAQAFNKLKGNKNYVKEAEEKAKALYDAKASNMKNLAASEGEDWRNSALGQAALKKYLPEAEKNARQAGQLGRDMSLAYMAIVSNSDVFNSALEHGASRSEAAAIAFGSTLGMFVFDKYSGLGELFFDEATEDSIKAARQAIKNEIFGYTDKLGQKHLGIQEAFNKIKTSNLSPTNKLLAYIKKSSEISKKFMSNFSEDLKYHTTGLLGKALGEGLEEVGEELISDTSKAFYELAGKFGLDTSTKDVGAWDNALERYSMSLFGGMLGGGIFYAKEKFVDGRDFKRDKSNEEIATLIRNGHIGELRSTLKKLHKQGKLGNTKLSTEYEVAVDDKGNKNLVWLTSGKKTQNDAIYEMINDKITSIDTVINNNQINLSDDQLFQQMVLSEQRFAKYYDIAPYTNYYQDFNDILVDLSQAELNLKAAANTVDGTVNGEVNDEKLRNLTDEQKQLRTENLQNLSDKLQKLRDKKNKFLSGDSSFDYTRKLNFIIDPILHSQFLAIDQEQLWKQNFGDKTIDKATKEELDRFFGEIVPNSKKDKQVITAAWERFKQVEQTLIPDLEVLSQNTPQFKKWTENFQKLIKSDSFDVKKLSDSYKKYDDKLDDETDEEYKSRNSKLIDPVSGEEESDQEFINRQNERYLKIEAYNNQKDQEWAQKLLDQLQKVNYNVDPISASSIRKILPHRVKDIILRNIQFSNLSPKIKGIVKDLNNDFSNIDQIKETIKNSTISSISSEIINIINKLQNLDTSFTDDNGNVIQDTLYNYSQQEWVDLTINDLLSPEFEEELNKFNEGTKNDIIYILQQLQPIVGDIEINTLFDDKSSLKYWDSFQNYIDTQLSFVNNEIDSIVSNVQNNKIFQINNNLKTTIKNPVIEIVKSLAGKTLGNTTIPEIDNILSTIEDKYQNLEDISMLTLDGVQLENLTKVQDVLKLVNLYIYAASSYPDTNKFIGHNKVMNEYTKNHQDLMEKAELLPEIDSDYALIYQNELSNYIKSLDYWIDLSNRNRINKRAQFIRIDEILNKSLLNQVINNYNDSNFTVEVNNKRYNLLEGLNSSNLDSNQSAKSLFDIQKILYTNFQNYLADSGLSVNDFLEKSQLLEKLINISDIQNQEVIQLNNNINENKLTNYDKLEYYAHLLTLNPVDFYTFLKGRVSQDTKIAPITSQEYDVKIAVSALNQQFRDIMSYAHNKSGDTKYAALNTVYIPGAAGAGKTDVVGKIIKNYANTDIIALGPTKKQSNTLQKSIGASKSYTISEFLKEILGNNVYSEIKSDINSTIYNTTNKKFISDSKYFDVWEGEDGFAKFKLKDDANIVFNTLQNSPKLLMIDEATHLNTIEAQILDKYMKSIGGLQVLFGDPNQRGYFNSKNGLANIREQDIFTIRTPKLGISLRDNNIQKQQNLENVTSLLDQILNNLVKMTESELQGYWPQAKKLLSKLNFSVYNKDDINGDLITNKLTKEIISKIKSTDIGFIGDKNSSTYQALQEAGLADNVSVLSLGEMQGQEFDYVIIDQDFKEPTEGIQVRNFLQNLYTLMSRGRTASIFIDNGLSSIIGNNNISTYKAKAPNLRDVINGTSAVDELRQIKTNILNSFDLSEIKVNNQPQQQQLQNHDADFVNPDTLDIDKKLKEIIQLSEKEDESNQNIEQAIEYGESEFTVPTFGDVVYLSVDNTKEVTKTGKDGKEYSGKLWKITHKQNEPLRNLQALFNDGEEAFWYQDKMKWQSTLFDVRSALIFDHNWDETKLGTSDRILPSIIRTKFNKQDWENGTYEIEIRNPEGEVLPLSPSMKEIGFDYNGNKYIVDLVFKVKDKQGRECIFDLGGLNNPNTLNLKQEEIKNNIRDRLKNDKSLSNEDRDKLNNILGTIDSEIIEYENLFNTWINQYNNTGRFSLNISKAVQFNKKTWFKKRLTKQGNPSLIRLGGKIDPSNIDGDQNSPNLMDMNPGMVFSDIYTYAAKDSDTNEIDSSLLGKAVIFVSSDTLLKPSELINRYIAQKKNPKDNTPVVRMIVLGNYGMTLSQLYDPKFIKFIQQGKEERKPIRQNFVGIQMFTSLWNYRASLQQFINALNKWKNDNNYDTQKLNVILSSQQYIFDNKLSGKELEDYISSRSIKKEDIDNLEKFNQEICKDIPTFRLGYNKNGNGFHIQSFDTTNSKAYDENKANLIVITPELANKYLYFYNQILSALGINSVKSSLTLGLQFLKEDGKTPWKEDELIDLKQASHRRSLSNIVKLDKNKQLVIVSGGQQIAYPVGNEWSAIPRLISSIIKTTTYFQYHPDDLLTGLETAKIQLYKTDQKGEEVKEDFEVQVGNWFDGQYKLEVKKDNTQEHPDRTLMDMLELTFHGTTQDIHDVKNPPIKATDARFKNGFYINPDISRKKLDVSSQDIMQFGDQDIFFYAIETNPELFTVDVDLRSSGISMSVGSLKSIYQEYMENKDIQKKVPEESKENETSIAKQKEVDFQNKYPNAYKAISDLINLGQGEDLDYSEASIKETVDILNKSSIVLDLIEIDKEESLQYPYNHYIDDNGDIQVQTLEQYLLSQLSSGEQIEDIKYNNGTFEVKTNQNKYIFNKDNEQLEAEKKNNSLSTTRLDKSININGKDTTVKQAIQDILNDENFRQQVIDNSIFGVEDETINNLDTEIKNIISNKDLNDDLIASSLQQVKDNDEYTDILSVLSENYQDLYKTLFNNC